MIPVVETGVLLGIGAIAFLIVGPRIADAWCEVDELLDDDPQRPGSGGGMASLGRTTPLPSRPSEVIGKGAPTCGPLFRRESGDWDVPGATETARSLSPEELPEVPVEEIERERAFWGPR